MSDILTSIAFFENDPSLRALTEVILNYEESSHLYEIENELIQRILEQSMNYQVPPIEVVNMRKRRRIVRKENEPVYQLYKTIVKNNGGRVPSCSMCTICGENFNLTDQVAEGAKGQYYHRKELIQWVKTAPSSIVKDPNTGTIIPT
jgi:hypothetical protein